MDGEGVEGGEVYVDVGGQVGHYSWDSVSELTGKNGLLVIIPRCYPLTWSYIGWNKSKATYTIPEGFIYRM